ncbi:alpha/beta hydrolase [Stakelama tenebrarum]|uniref:Alpha/beta hydrolase n=1 Tax=Stakelama tenebrarum TaxID=2711215 RepID=A0A6G6Y7X7_9SPHN|nr:alpha/beta hydrolase [Sphingosinithalassobacter tenebrarum]QIG80676.1 alpha/beta hydrolase [Sphingosinithalassobacter tenebrarum]
MRRTFIASLAAAFALLLAGGCARALGITQAVPATAIQSDAREIAYGGDSLQRLDYYPAPAAGAPLIVFVHGGGWKRGDKGNATGETKVRHFHDRGYAFASINYRLVPDSTVEQQATDVAHALGYLITHAPELGFDASRIVLMGHSAGAHLAALVGTDPRYLRDAGLGLDALDGVILLDGAAYDVSAQIAEGNRFMHDTYVQAFGENPARQRALSPLHQAAAPNAPAFLILHVQRDDGRRQSQALAQALHGAGTAAALHALPGRGFRGHRRINQDMGDPGYAGTAIVDGWIAGLF